MSIATFAQDTTGIGKAVSSLNEVLVNKDSVTLKQLLADDLVYGHSNGWMQSKRDIINDMFSGKLEYKKIEAGDAHYTLNRRAIVVTSLTKVEGAFNGKAFSMSLQVFQVWKKEKHRWILIARQGVKLS
jgi:ketosteroid isomerase-like protein